ncbi:HD-GYP domain-containing protein [Ornithinibacillus halotolerans]|uniref:Phosphodiesterase n=1 Tax=Ornithinibacillus halotolerans TaxID=1274357 RepID=A0A916S100_9BACI|nr:HD-GYP domain-containing protein [Ornithinibacillus halotolerans]GGA76792.1 phosphodiesterase [Ornithinibacillus halotolerans]
MRLVSLRSIKPGNILGQTIYRENGTILLQNGVTISDRILERLEAQGISYVYIEDESTNDITTQSVISERLRQEAVSSLKKLFTNIRKGNLKASPHALDEESRNITEVITKIKNDLDNHPESISILTDIYLMNDYIYNHSLNVAIYSLAIGMKLGLNSKELLELGKGAMLHDIGKVFIDSDIINKPTQLTVEEFEVMKSHTTIGYNLLRKTHTYSSLVAHCAYQHHERLNGSGYPRGLKENEIHLFAQIIGVADVFDAMTSNRVYKKALLPHEAMEFLYSAAVNQFDKKVVEAFKSSVAIYPNGITVELNDKRQGIVISQNKNICDRPIIRIEKDGSSEVTAYEVDLSKELNLTIINCY